MPLPLSPGCGEGLLPPPGVPLAETLPLPLPLPCRLLLSVAGERNEGGRSEEEEEEEAGGGEGVN